MIIGASIELYRLIEGNLIYAFASAWSSDDMRQNAVMIGRAITGAGGGRCDRINQ